MRKLTLCMGLVLMVSAPLIAQAEGGAEALARWHQQNKDGGERGYREEHLPEDAKFQGGGDSGGG